MRPLNVFVAARGNAFMTDIAGWVVEAALLLGRQARLVLDRLPTLDGSLNLVVAPHEFFELFPAPPQDLRRAAMSSVAIATEQPGTKWFDLTLDVARHGLATYDINAHGVEALRAAGIDAHRLQLGAVPSMISDQVERTVDVLFLGSLDERRGEALAGLADHLVDHRSALHLFSFDRPVGPHTPGLVFGPAKYRQLAAARTLLNIHRGRAGGAPPYFEWARMVEAMANRCVVVTEPSDGHAPLLAGTHFVEADITQLGDALDQLLADPAGAARIAGAAFDAVTGELALRHAVAAMLDHLERDVQPRLEGHVRSGPPRARWRLGASQAPPPVRLPAFTPFRQRQRQAKALAMAESDALRRLDGLTCLLRHGATQHVERWETPSYATAMPEVSVIVSVYDYAAVVRDALDSVLACRDVDFEVIIVDDHATDASRSVVARYLDEHPEVPMVLIGKDANEGLAAARNTAFEHARAELVMVLDADNQLLPTCLRKLADALSEDADAAGAYGILADFGDRRHLRSAFAWDVERLCSANYIDAQTMLRKRTWAQLGGYRGGDHHVFGWEDWDLWLRLAEAGGRLRLVPEILGRYRVQAGSMIALTNLGHADAVDALRRRHPTLPWPVTP